MTDLSPTTYTPDHLHAVTEQVWRALGGPADEARLLADHLVAANLAGHDSHGVGLLVDYAQSLQGGGLKLGRRPKIVSDTGVVVTLEADHGLGQVAGFDAMNIGIERAGTHGAAVVGLRHTHHVARVGHWAEQCAAAGFASLHMVSVPGNLLVAPHGGSDARFGTNPFCAAFPRPGADPIVADFATSQLAMGKMRVALNSGTPVPAGTLIDSEGRPTTDPAVLFREPFGALLSAGWHKGSAMAVLFELFSAALIGGHTTSEQTATENVGIVNGMFSVIVDPAAFGAVDQQAQAELFLNWVKASPPAEGVDEVLLPGEVERRTREQRTAHGIPLDPVTWQQILDVAAAAGLDPLTLEP